MNARGAPNTVDGTTHRLADAQVRVNEARVELREAIDDRNVLVFEAIDVFHVSHRDVASVLGLKVQSVEYILAAGLPERRPMEIPEPSSVE